MKRLHLFETPKKQTSSGLSVSTERVSELLIPMFIKFNYRVSIIQIEKIGSGILIMLKRGENTVLILPWIRPYTDQKNLIKTLADYPRLNIRKDLLQETDEMKIDSMWNVCEQYNLHFLVMLQKTGGDLFWFQKYTDIPKEYWKTTYRKKEKGNDRIHFPKYNEYKFIDEKTLRKEIIKSQKI